MDFFLVYILPVLYVAAALWLLRRANRTYAWGYKPVFVVFFCVAKAGVGLFYTWIMQRYIPAAQVDIDTFFGDGLELYNQLWEDPAAFPQYLQAWFAIDDFHLADTRSDIVQSAFNGIKLIHFTLCLFSGGHLYTNVLLFNCLAAFLYLRAWYFLRIWLGSWVPGFFIWMFPAAFFFTSVILKEGIEWCILAAAIPAFYGVWHQKKVLSAVLLIPLLLLLFFFKFLIGATFVATLLLMAGLHRFPAYKGRVFLGTMLVGTLLFFVAPALHPALNVPQYIVNRRVEFMELEANSALTMRPLEATPLSYLQALPEALTHVFLSPLPWQPVKPVYMVFLLEMLLFWGMVVGLLVRSRAVSASSIPAVAWGLLFFGLVNLLVIGYSITNVGAIIRYRSIFLPLCLVFIYYRYAGFQIFAGAQAVAERIMFAPKAIN